MTQAFFQLLVELQHRQRNTHHLQRSEEIADAMQKLAEDDTWAAELAERGRKRVREFTWAACAQQTLDVYQSVAG